MIAEHSQPYIAIMEPLTDSSLVSAVFKIIIWLDKGSIRLIQYYLD